MLNTKNRSIVLAAALVTAVAGTASATTINSFLTNAQFYGITVSPVTAPVGGSNVSYTVTLDAGAYMRYNNVNYPIDSINGFYALSYGHDVSQPSLNASGLFTTDNKHQNAGSIYGWKSNPNNGITAGHSHTFTYQTLSSQYTQFGFHVSVADCYNFPGTNGQTGNVTGTFNALVTPTPGSAALLGIGALAASRRRRV
ncbi:MAG: hypothetical protein QM783_20370 [Phycisphaerales bacterium]